MIGKPSHLTLVGMALVCAAILAACCNSSALLRYIVVAPNNGDIYVSAPAGGAIKGARRAPAHTAHRATVSPEQLSSSAVCGSLQYTATGYYSDGSIQTLSTGVIWSSSSAAVATIDPNAGLATGVGLGFTNIGAVSAGVTATPVQLEVDQLNSITVAAVPPVTSPLPIAGTQQFSAVGAFTLASGGNTTQDISSQVTWSTGNANVATVSSTGLVTAVGAGSTTVYGTSCDGLTQSNTVAVVVTGTQTTLVVTPNPITAATGTTVQFTAMELTTGGTLQAPESPVSWSSSATTTASINATTGLAQALSASSTAVTITASEPANPNVAPGTATFTVQAAAARFAYVANPNGGSPTGSISTYIVTVGSSTPLAPNTNENPSGIVAESGNPQQVLLHPSGDLLFYIDAGGAVHSFYVNSTNGVFGSTPTGQPATAATNAGNDLYAGVIDPTGRFLYVASQGNVSGNQVGDNSGVIYGFTITHTQPSGGTNDAQLTPISGVAGFNDGTINTPSWILTDQTGQYLYIVNETSNTVSEYAINQTPGSLGQLTALGNSPVSTGPTPYIGRTDTNGHLYVANTGDGAPSVSAYTITPSGQETPAGELVQIGSGPTPITGAVDTISVIASPNGNYLYVLDDDDGEGAGQVFPYGLTQPSGVISTSAIGSAQATGVAPFGGMAIDPTGVLLAIDNGSDGTISLYTIGSTGTLTPLAPAAAGGPDANTEYFVFYTAASGQ